MLNLTGEVKYKRNMSRFPSRPKNYLIERIHHVLPLPVREYLLIHLSNRKHLPCSINVLLPITRGVVLCFDCVPLHRSAQFGCAKILRTPAKGDCYEAYQWYTYLLEGRGSAESCSDMD